MTLQGQIENIEFLARQVVEGFIIGLHKSPFHGFSVEFAEHRLYNTGDNLKHIDWKVYGRSDKLFIKKYEEETNLRCQIVIDTSSSMLFPQDAALNKLQFSCLAAAALKEILRRQLDAVGISLFDQSVYFHSKCKSNVVHHKMLTAELERLLTHQESSRSTQAVNALHQIAENIHKRSLVIIFSDMLERISDMDAIFDALQHLKYNKHEVILFQVQDKRHEVDFEYDNRPYEFIDLETGEKIRMNSNSLKASYQEKMHEFRQKLALKCGQFGIDIVDADINQGYDQILLSYLIKRNKMV